MGAAQNQGVQPSPVGGEELLQHIDGPAGVNPARLHNLHQPGRRYFIDIAGDVVAVQQPGEFFLRQGHGRRHNADAAAGVPVRRQLQGRLDAHDDKIRVLFPQVLHGGGGSRIAGDDQGFQPPGHKLFRHGKAQRPDLRLGADAVGSVGGVAVI